MGRCAHEQLLCSKWRLSWKEGELRGECAERPFTGGLDVGWTREWYVKHDLEACRQV